MRDRSFWILCFALLALTALRIAAASAYPLVDDEAYYWVWSRHLAWGYPDHPPAVAAMVRVTTLLGGDSAVAIRLGPILLAFGSSLLMYDLGRRMFSKHVGMLAAAGYQLLPIAAVGAIFTFPDAPLIFFWILAVWCAWQARTGGHTWAWYGMGLAVGLGLMSKLSALFLAGSLVGFFFFSRVDRLWLRRPEPYRAAAIALTVLLPFIAWNGRHDWTTFIKTLNPTPWIDLDVPAKNAAAYLAASAVYYGPIIILLLLAALGTCMALARRGDGRFTMLAWLAAPLIGFTFAASFRGIPKPHWPAPAYLMLLLAAAALWREVRERAWWRRAAITGIAMNVLVVAALYALPHLPSPAAQSLRGWDQASAAVVRLMEEERRLEPFILTEGYQHASQLAYYLHERYSITTARKDNAIAMRLDPDRFLDRNAIFIADLYPGPRLPLHLMFRRLDRRPDIRTHVGTGNPRWFQIYIGYEFRGFPRARISPI